MSSGPAKSAAAGRPVRSIAARLFWLFTGASVALLICVSVGLYWAVFQYMQGRADVLLAGAAADARADLAEPEGPKAVAEELAESAGAPLTPWLRVLDEKAHTAAETNGMTGRLPPGVFPRAIGDGMQRAEYHAADGEWFSLASFQAQVAGHAYVIQAAENRKADRDFLERLRVLLAGVLVCGILFSGALSRIVTAQGLAPLAAMAATVQRIGAPRLNQRLSAQAWPRELGPLVAAFDEMMDRLEESFTRLSQFSADLAHELRTPISNLRGEAEVALAKARGVEEYRQVLESSLEEHGRLSELIAKLLFLARAEAAETVVKPEMLDAQALAGTIRELYEPCAEECGVALTCEAEGHPKADPILFRRAVANLIENALRYTPPGGRVCVSIHGGTVTVRDTGCGIPPEHLPRIFDRFHRVDPARSEGGAGLGLALVQTIMKLHGGAVSISSEPGQGTEAILQFPI